MSSQASLVNDSKRVNCGFWILDMRLDWRRWYVRGREGEGGVFKLSILVEACKECECRDKGELCSRGECEKRGSWGREQGRRWRLHIF